MRWTSRRCESGAARRAAAGRGDRAATRSCAALAELDNVRKRAQRDIENAQRYALERFAAELLPVRDSLELAAQSAGHRRRAEPGRRAAGDAAAARQGVRQILDPAARPAGRAVRSDAARGGDDAGVRHGAARQRAAGAAIGLPAQRPAAAAGAGRVARARRRMVLEFRRPLGPSYGPTQEY